MIVFSQDKKNIYKCNNFSVQKNLGGGKDKKFCIYALRKNDSGRILAYYCEEKTAIDVLTKLFEAIENGEKSFVMPEDK